MKKKDVLIRRVVRILLWTSFAVYLLVLVKLLFLDGRHPFDISFGEFVRHSNWIPFRTVVGYLQRLSANSINLDIVVRNLLGNLILFFPMGCYLPCLGRWLAPLWKRLLLLVGMILGVEVLQLILRVGFFDVDDVIFNFFGGAVASLLFMIPWLCRGLQRVYLLSGEGEKEGNLLFC